ncbi:type IV pilin protein [Colwellia maritima]|nr:type IV pilin protein [Colwellia maritima]
MNKLKKSSGFTLMELMITVAIIGILAGIAYPSYVEFVLRSNRSEAQRELMRFANLQEQVFVDTRAYAANMVGLGESSATITTESTNYEIQVLNQTATTFTLRATGKNNQVKDVGCVTLNIDQLGTKTPRDCWEN